MSQSSTFCSETMSSRYTSPEHRVTATSLHEAPRNVADPWNNASRHFMDQQQYSRLNTLPAGKTAATAGLRHADDEFQFHETPFSSRARRTLLSYRSVISAPDPTLVRQIAEVVGSQRPPALYVPDVVSLTPSRSTPAPSAMARGRAAPMVYTTEKEGDGSQQRSYRVVEDDDLGDGLAALGKMRAARRSAAAAAGRRGKSAGAPLGFLASKEGVQQHSKASARRLPPPPPPTAGERGDADASFSATCPPMRTVDAVKYRNEVTAWLMDVDEGLQLLRTALESGGKVARISNAMRLDPKYVQHQSAKSGALAPIHPLDAPRNEQRRVLDEFVQAVESVAAASVELVSTYLTQEEKRFLGVNTHRYQSTKQRSSSYQYCNVKPRAASSKSERAINTSQNGGASAGQRVGDVSTASSQPSARKAVPHNDIIQLLSGHKHASQTQRSADVSMNSSVGTGRVNTYGQASLPSRGTNGTRKEVVPETVVTKREAAFAYPPAAPVQPLSPPLQSYDNSATLSDVPVVRTELRRLPDIPSLVVSQASLTPTNPPVSTTDSAPAGKAPDAVERTSSSYSTLRSQHHEFSDTPTEESGNAGSTTNRSRESGATPAAAPNRARSASHRSSASSSSSSHVSQRSSATGTATTELASQHEQPRRRRSSSAYSSAGASEYSNTSFHRGRGRQPFGDATPSERSHRIPPTVVGDVSTLREFGVEENRSAQTRGALLPPRQKTQQTIDRNNTADDSVSSSSVSSRIRRLAPPPPPASLPKRANSRSESNRGLRVAAPHLPAGRSSSIGTQSVPLSGFSTPAVHTPRTVDSSTGGDMLQLKRLPIPVPTSYEPFESQRGQSPPGTGNALPTRHDFKNLMVQSDSD